jgi:hypothetical protein
MKRDYHEDVEISSRLYQIVDEEIARAIEKYGELKSRHEAYAVMLEEFEEAKCEAMSVEAHLSSFWRSVKTDSDIANSPQEIFHYAMNAAVEFLQVAAVAERFARQERKNRGKQTTERICEDL